MFIITLTCLIFHTSMFVLLHLLNNKCKICVILAFVINLCHWNSSNSFFLLTWFPCRLDRKVRFSLSNKHHTFKFRGESVGTGQTPQYQDEWIGCCRWTRFAWDCTVIGKIPLCIQIREDVSRDDKVFVSNFLDRASWCSRDGMAALYVLQPMVCEILVWLY